MIAACAVERALVARARVVYVVAVVAALVALVLGTAPASAVTPVHGHDTAATAYDAVAYTYDGPSRLSSPDTAPKVARGSPPGPGATSWASPVSVGGRGVAANAGAGLSDDVVRLAEQNITNSGDTVLGHFPGYINKANARGASYFDIGDAWNGLTDAQRWAANSRFLDSRIAAGDRVLLSLPRTEIRPGSYLAREVQYLTDNGYRWVNQWALRPGG